MANKLPVYLFTGFLEGGKTHIIQESMEDKKFNSGEKTLLIQCEEGIDEFDFSRFWGKNVYLETIDEESQVTKEHLTTLAQKRRIDRVIEAGLMGGDPSGSFRPQSPMKREELAIVLSNMLPDK